MWVINNAGDQTHAQSRIRATNIVNLFSQLTGTTLFPQQIETLINCCQIEFCLSGGDGANRNI